MAMCPREEFRLNRGRLLRSQAADLCGARSKRIYARVQGALFKRFRGLVRVSCPFQNLPENRKGRWGGGLTAEDMSKCRWLEPRLVAAVEFAEWTSANHLRHCKYIALREDKDPNDVVREVLAAEV